MTEVYAKRRGDRCYLTARGHATGSVEVCAGISAILYALAGYLVNVDESRRIDILDLSVRDANVKVDFYGDDGSVAAFEMAVIGLLQIAKANPEFLHVKKS